MWLERILELRSNYGKVLVYGASGDQGVPLVNTLIKNGYKIRAASRYPENYNSEIEGDVESVKADLFDIDTLKKASQDVDCIAMNLPLSLIEILLSNGVKI